MLRPGMWRHKNCLDVDFEIVKVQYRGPKYTKVKIRYWNRNYKYFIDWRTETVKIQREHFKHWSPC